jgi:hypothetical protein
MISALVDGLWNPEEPKRFWLSDPYQYDQAVTGIHALLEHLRPEGSPELPSESPLMRAAAELQGRERMELIIETILSASPASDAVPSRISGDLGPRVVRRMTEKPVAVGTASEIRADAEILERSVHKDPKPKTTPKRKRRIKR